MKRNEFETRLQQKLGGYLSRQTVGRPKLKGAITDVITALPDTVIFGGMIREFALENTRGFVSDIDLVSSAPQSDISRVVAKYNAIRNKFGGFRFVLEKQRFDIWSLADTWAFKNGFASGTGFVDLLATSFFNIDAACYHVESKRLLCLPEYGEWIKGRVLDINLLQNPNPQSMARRALVLMQTRQLTATRRLAEYVSIHLEREALTWFEKLLMDKLDGFLANDALGDFRFSPQSELMIR
jgi:hypothetical protein